jgi:hypothetical protein
MGKNKKNKVYLVNDDDKRIIGTLKAVFAVMVVFIHANFSSINMATGSVTFDFPKWFTMAKTILSDAIPKCAVPGFFIMASVLLFKREFDWKKNVLKKARTLMIPYFIINTFWILFYACAQMVPSVSVFFSNPDKIVANWSWVEYLDAYLGTGVGSGVHLIYAPLWFVEHLFVLNIISPVIKMIIDKIPVIYGVAIICLLVFDVNFNMFFLNNVSLFYFSLGYYLVKYGIHFSDVKNIDYRIITPLYIAVTVLNMLTLGDERFASVKDLAQIIIGLLWWAHTAIYLSGLEGVPNAVLKTLEKYNFIIYIFHYNSITILQKLLFKLLPNNLVCIVAEYFISAIIMIVLCIVLAIFMERFMPRIFSLLIGDRDKKVKAQ